MRYIAWISLTVLGIAVVVGGWRMLGSRESSAKHGEGPGGPTSDEYSGAPRAMGRLKPAGEVIDLGAVMGDRLARLLVAQGDAVKQGQPLAYLDSYALRQLEIEATETQLGEARERANAELKLAEARIIAAQLGVERVEAREAEIQSEELKLPVLKQYWELAQRDLERISGLPSRLVSNQEREKQTLAVQKAATEWQAADRLITTGRSGNALALKAAQADLGAAEAAKQAALTAVPQVGLEKKLELARAQAERSVLRAPSDGAVLTINVRPGELIGAAPVMQIANLDHMAVVAQVYETDVKRLREGQKAIVKSRSFRPPYDERGLTGAVTYIGRVASRPSLKELDPLAPTDRRAVDVRIKLDDEECRRAQGFVQMEVEVVFPAAES